MHGRVSRANGARVDRQDDERLQKSAHGKTGQVTHCCILSCPPSTTLDTASIPITILTVARETMLALLLGGTTWAGASCTCCVVVVDVVVDASSVVSQSRLDLTSNPHHHPRRHGYIPSANATEWEPAMGDDDVQVFRASCARRLPPAPPLAALGCTPPSYPRSAPPMGLFTCILTICTVATRC